MKTLLIGVLAAALAGCAQVENREQAVRARDAAMQAAAQRMIVTRQPNIPAHPTYTVLGNVQGYCRNDPEADDIVPEGDNLREAAYRKYGNNVDAILGAHSWFVPNANYIQGATQPDVNTGHFECAGTAVHFSGS
jgi:hypothetical protein